MSVPDDGYARNASSALNLISTLLSLLIITLIYVQKIVETDRHKIEKNKTNKKHTLSEQFQNPRKKSYRGTKSIPLTHKYISSHFYGTKNIHRNKSAISMNKNTFFFNIRTKDLAHRKGMALYTTLNEYD